MSDANNLDNNTNNLSVDENDFEAFQSTAVKEESDYIMLSDILSDEVKQPTEMPGEFDDFLYENDEASQEFQTHLNDVVNSQLADAVTAADNGAVDTLQPPEAVGKKPAQKRATRKGKAPKVAASKNNELESTDIGNTRKSTRGRKPRVIPDTVVTPEYEEKVFTKTTRRSAPQRSAALANGSAHQPAVKKRRGRQPKKVSAEPEQTNVENNVDIEQEGDDICLSKLKAQLSSSSQENNTDIKPILSDFEFNIDNVIVQTPSVVVESVDSNFKPLQLQDNLVQDNLVQEDMEIETFNNVVPKCEEPQSFGNIVPKSEDLEITNTEVNDQLNPEGLLVEDTSKRPVRKKARRTTKYQFDSDEDPFANVEESEDERPQRRKKGTKYYSDDEYIPGGEFKQKSSEDEIEDIDEFDSEYEGSNPFANKKRKRGKRTDGTVQNRTPKKMPKVEPEVTTLPPAEASDDFEQMLESSVIKSDPELIKSCIGPTTPSQEFENFLANRIPGNELLIKKVSSFEKPPLEIPSINPKELPKMVERSSQTNTKETTSSYVQTSSPYAIKMVHNINFTGDQSEKACEFLKNILSTTTELGKLMTEKSEEFMQKKINTTHVKDTTKMDYCVKKAFLLFKLAKDNLTTMEETLEKQYEEFLRTNDLHSAIAVDTKIAPKPVVKDDSDCEIIDDPIPAKATNTKPGKSNASAKTVFLNKELSIKIAKKAPPPTVARSTNASSNIPNKTGKNLNIQGKTSVWLNSSVMVKKVKPTNHFLAQDGRNKKPPDFVTDKMVKDFFDQYFKSKASEICAQFTSPNWLLLQPSEVTCNYFVAAASDNETSTSTIMQPIEPFVNESEHTNGHASTPNSIDDIFLKAGLMPKSLVSLCTKACNKLFKLRTNGLTVNHKDVTSLSNLCLIKLTTKVKEETTSVLIANLEDSVEYPIEDSITDDEQLCLDEPNIDESSIDEIVEIPALKTLCFNVVSQYFKAPTLEMPSMVTIAGTFDWDLPDETSDLDSCISSDLQRTPSCLSLNQEVETFTYNAKSLQSIVYQYLLHVIYGFSKPAIEKNLMLKDSVMNLFEVKTLFKICFQLVSRYINPEPQTSEILPFKGLTIDTINTMSDEAFHGIGADDNYDNDNYTADDDYFNRDDYNNDDDEPQNEQAEESWMAKAKLKELRLGVISSIIGNTETEDALEPQTEEPFITRIKTEIPDEIPEDPIQIRVKTEPEEHNEMVSIPDDIVTKAERQDYLENGQGNVAGLTNIDADGFESFIRGNKMIQGVSSCLEGDDNIFSQSAYRVRRQHAPDSDEEKEHDMDLLVPHDSEVFDMVKTKGNLMHSSSDDDEKSKLDKKSDKKKKGKTKKQPEPKQAKAVEVPKKNLTKEKAKPLPEPVNEVAILTRRMREKIRNEEKKHESDSDSELNLNKAKTNKDKNDKQSSKSDQTTTDNEIQCNSVDSTAVITDNKEKVATRKSARKRDADVEDTFTGFNNEDLSEIEKYKKQLDDVYDKILSEDMPDLVLEQPAANDEVSNASDRFSPPLMTDEPAEILECEPTMPIFEPKKPRKSRAKPVEKPESSTESAVETGTEDNISLDKVKLTPTKDKKKKALVLERPFEEKDGWKCYQMDVNDSKLHQVPYIGLEKLPEAFVQTYFRYQEINCISKEDVEVDRLANLQSLHRSGKEPKPPKGKGKLERSTSNPSGATTADVSPIGSDAEHFEELVPSDDETHLHDNEDVPSLPLKQTENVMAKSLLMDDKESASDGEGGRIRVKKEKPGDADDQPLSKRKTPKNVRVVDHPKNLVLTADKMMKKELDLLHAPVTLDEDLKYSPPDVKPKLKHSSKSHTKRERRKSRGDDSSSEEEKLWVNTKSKLLKRMEKRVQEDPCVDDAKRAKIVSEYIDRRTDVNLVRVGKKRMPKRMSRKKMLEREKQMRVLSKEFTEGPGLVGKGSSMSYSKGRRNIRKVLDKKSLARSTVTANMEEFARKRRLHMKQNRLRELLGYEEDVNVLVINDEVCLEYDFKELQPVVTIHPFFTRVMKAHQYEGVKFMWDACFESLEVIASGHPGAGCILAHCMGLGKTLQVLALLHTVLTHPKVGMHRVLVCCPLSTVLNWVDEIHKWLGPVTNQIKVFELSKLKKTYERAYQLEDWYTGGGIFIVGYELFRSLTTLDPEYDDIRPTIVKKIRMALLDPGPDIVVCDEGHLLKNDSSVLALAMSRVKTKRRIVLTGTPMQNNLREYFCMVNFIKPNLLGTYSEYSNRFENPIMNGQHRDSREEDIRLMKARTHILHKVLEGCLQRQEASVLYPYLPTKHEYTVFIKLSDAQTDLYKHYLHNYAKSNRLNNKNSNNILKDFHILQKIWSHPHVLHSFLSRVRDDKVNKLKEERIEDDLAREELAATEDVKPIDAETGWWLEYLDNGKLLDELEASTKFQVVFNILKECVALDDKLLIFSTSLYTMDSLEYFLKKINNWSLGQEYYRLDGTVPPEVRHKWCREFNAENNHKTKLFLISTRAGCLGLNMTAANRVIILDTSWNPAHDIQSIFRIYRFGQKKDCFIYRLVAMGTMEQKIYERSVTKQAVACRVVDEQQIDRHYNMADLAELYDFSRSGWGISCGVAGAVRDVVLLRAARLACVHAAHEHDSLLRAARDQDLPEDERAAAWDQFQLEHEHTKVQTGMALALSVFGPQQAAIPTDFGLPVPAVPIPDPNVNPQLHPHPNQHPVTFKTEPTPIPNLLAPLPPKQKEKGKKGKKSKTETVGIPEKDLKVNRIEITSNNPKFNESAITIIPPKGMKDPGNILDRIREILKNTDFRNSEGVIDAAQITKVISSLVSSEQITVAPPKSNVQPTISAPPIETVTKQPIAEVPKVGKGKRGRPKKDAAAKAVEKPELKKAPENDLDPHISRDGRYKRKAAVVAERNLESRDLTVSSDDDFDNDASQDYQPDDNDASQDYQPDHNDASQDSDFIAPVRDKPVKDKSEEANNKNNQNDSILLSDDDDVVNTNSTPKVNSTVIPMHRSLLKNKNFIKIVAHTYLKGNPMLDEDAAMLAAEYSTNKALKEVEMTGKDIDSGPIFDIAMQVLGVEVLKKLIEKDSNKSTTAEKGMMISFQKLPIKEEPADGTTSKAKASATKPTETPKIRIKTEKEMRLPAAPAQAPVVLQNQPSRRKAQIQNRQMFEDDDIGADMNSGLLLRMRNQPPQVMNPVQEMKKYKPGPSSVKAAKARRSMAGPSMAGPSIAGSSMAGPSIASASMAGPSGSMQAMFEESIVQSAIQKFVPSDSGANNNAGVVPIGMFKGNENLGLTMPVDDEECILPDDDDDLRIGLDPQVRPPNLALPPNITPVILRANLSQPTLQISPMTRRLEQNEQNANVASDSGPTVTDGNKTLQLKRVTSLPEILSAKKQKLAQQQASAATNSETISLDSDDDDAPLVAPVNPPQAQIVRTTNAQGNQCIVISASTFQEILKRAQATPVNNLDAQKTIQPVTQTSKAQVKTGDKLFIPSSKPVGPASKTVGPASKTVGPASKTAGPASKTAGPATQTRAAKTVAAAKIAIPAKPPPAPPKPPARVKTPPKPPPVKYPDIAISSSSESDRSRSPSPTDPMSILRNVVHIQANPAPAPPKPLCNIKPAAKANPFAGVPAKQNPAQTKASPAHSKNTRSNQPTKPAPSNPPLSSNTSARPPQPKLKMADNVKVKTLPDSRIAVQTAKSAQASKTVPTKTNTQLSKTTPQTKAKNSKDDSNYRLLGSFDLTDLPELSVSKTPDKPGPSAAKPRSKEPVKPTTVTGKSRDIILTPGNKSGVKAIAKEPSILEKANAVKRKPEPPPPPVAPAPKKKKPTRLEEFSLDDLEDIIELE